MTPIQRAQADMAFQMLLARIAGQRAQATSEGYVLVGFYWRDKLYVTESYKAPENL